MSVGNKTEDRRKTVNARLTLNMEKHLIDSAKEYSAKTGKSLSRLVADFFELLRHDEQLEQASQLPPTVQSLKGVLKGGGATAEDYKKYLEAKHL
jgi:hypothetical protein